MTSPKNARGRAVTKLCLALESFRRTDAGRVRDAKAFLAHYFPHTDASSTDRLFLHMPNEVRGELLAGWGIRGKKSALLDGDAKVLETMHDALVAGDVDARIVEDAVTPQVLVDWVPLDDWWAFWRGSSLPLEAVRKGLAVARELSLFDEKWFLQNLSLAGPKLTGTDVVCAALTKDQVIEWVRAVHASGDASPSGLITALGWETVLAKTAHEALLFALDALARQVGLVAEQKPTAASPEASSSRAAATPPEPPPAAPEPPPPAAPEPPAPITKRSEPPRPASVRPPPTPQRASVPPPRAASVPPPPAAPPATSGPTSTAAPVSTAAPSTKPSVPKMQAVDSPKTSGSVPKMPAVTAQAAPPKPAPPPLPPKAQSVPGMPAVDPSKATKASTPGMPAVDPTKAAKAQSVPGMPAVDPLKAAEPTRPRGAASTPGMAAVDPTRAQAQPKASTPGMAAVDPTRSPASSASPGSVAPSSKTAVPDLPTVIIAPDPPPSPIPSLAPTPPPPPPPPAEASAPPSAQSAPPSARVLFGTSASSPPAATAGALAGAPPNADLPPMRKLQKTLVGMGAPEQLPSAPATPVRQSEPALPTYQAPPMTEPSWLPPRAEAGDMGYDVVHGIQRPIVGMHVQPSYDFDDDDEPTSEIDLPEMRKGYKPPTPPG